jgi:NAD(P)-dependent dehydrogenase (short-subunit alcohol dehydrogenase family)
VQLFFPSANPAGACMLAVTAGGIVLDPTAVPGLSAYMTSKTAQVKLIEWLAVENPNLFTCSVHPGVVDTKMLSDAGLVDKGMPVDNGEYTQLFIVYSCGFKADGK